MGFKNNDRCLEKVGDDEPIFVLRAQDQSTPETVAFWIGRNQNHLSLSWLDEAVQQQQLIVDWQNAHPERVKAAD